MKIFKIIFDRNRKRQIKENYWERKNLFWFLVKSGKNKKNHNYFSKLCFFEPPNEFVYKGIHFLNL